MLSPAMLAEMRAVQARRFCIPVWGLGVTLFVPVGAGGYIIGHDGVNIPAISTTARLNPANGEALVVLSSGDITLARRIGSDWTYWQGGRIGIGRLGQELKFIARPGGGAWLAAIGLIALGGNRRSRHRPHPSPPRR